MRYFLGFALICCALSSHAVIQVHYFSNGTKKILFHTGASSQDMHDNLFRQMEGEYSNVIKACPFYPQLGHVGIRNMGVWYGAVSKDGVYLLAQVHEPFEPYYPGPLSVLHTGVGEAFCQGCSGNLGYFIEVGCVVVAGSGADQPWLWDGSADDNDIIQNLNYIFDESGNINGYTFDVNPSGLPFGALSGEGGNGQVIINPVSGPEWQWNPGVTPPIDPDIIGGIGEAVANIEGLLSLNQETLMSLATSGELSANTLASVLDSLELLNASQVDYSGDLGLMLFSLDEISLALAGGAGGVVSSNSAVDVSAVVTELQNMQILLLGEELEEENISADSSLLSAHDSLITALNPVAMKGKVEALSASGELFKNTVNSIFGEWKSLPRDKPAWTFDFSFPINGATYAWQWNSAEKIPDDWWLYVRILRNAEVIGLAIWLLMSLSKLLHKTFGGAS